MPDEFTSTQALLFQALTAEYLVTEYRDVRPGDRVLVHAAAGGVGLLLVQWLKHLGAWVVGTTSSDAKAELQRRAAVVIEAMGAGWLRSSDGTVFDLDRVADAHRAIEGRGTHGKLYLTP
jgi:NADPH:quinone reductase-like Zn-dependent oxidoreductase